MQSQVLKIKIPPEKIAYLKFILEGYSHLVVLTVENPKEGIVSLQFFPSEETLIRKILKNWQEEILLLF
ncbi:MAG: DUF4911 domain-containing protein [Thermodesulfobacteriaceae bacterium]|nr:DUF4911 domain-containing protein [Thermodesulfobacteriaceae bacterium]MDW8136787.1 DUF4911 domain-containing protein [Thermodesulfobacterium sp.]MDW8136792.1 DUF4911 domain-containing protein [Thermodesulfobacterium sp.]